MRDVVGLKGHIVTGKFVKSVLWDSVSVKCEDFNAAMFVCHKRTLIGLIFQTLTFWFVAFSPEFDNLLIVN